MAETSKLQTYMETKPDETKTRLQSFTESTHEKDWLDSTVPETHNGWQNNKILPGRH